MKKTILQGLLLLLFVLMLWWGFSRIDYVRHFEVERNASKLEKKLGDLIWEDISKNENVITNDSLIQTLDRLILPLCEANGIARDSLKVHLILDPQVNAFAFPDNHLALYSGLIQACPKQEALQGVIGHELAHLQHKHVMKKLSKEIGLSALLSTVAGEKGGGLLKEVFRSLSSSAYDRALEKEADLSGADYLINADINAAPLADFMYQMAQEDQLPEVVNWISDHPELEARSKYLLNHIKGKKQSQKTTLSPTEWENFKKALSQQE